MAQRRARPALERAAGLGDRAGGGEVAGSQRGEQALERRPPRAEADDDEARVRHLGEHERPRRGEQVDALGDDELADEEDVAVAPEVEPGQRAPGGGLVAREGMVLLDRRGGAQARGERGHLGRRLGGRAGTELGDVDPGRAEEGAGGERVVAHRRPQALGRVARADEHGARAGQPLGGRGQEARAIALDRVLERAAVDLDRVRDLAGQGAREDGRAHDQVVGQRDVGPRPRDDVADGGDVGGHVGLDLLLAAVGEGAGLHARVAIGHVDREQPADVRPPRRHAHGRAQHLDTGLAVLPRPHGVDERQLVRSPLLRDEVDGRSGACQRRGQARVVDVGAGAVQQVAVEDEDPHRRRI